MSFENKGSMAITVTVSREPDRSGNYVCDGTADDVQLQLARDYLVALGGGELVILGGTYNVDSETVILTDDISIRGVGAATIITPTGAFTTFRVGAAGTLVRDNYMGHMQLDGNFAGTIGLHIRNGVRGNYENLHIHSFDNEGIWGEFNHSNWFYGCAVQGCGIAGTTAGIKLGSEAAGNNLAANSFNFTKCTIEDCYHGVHSVQGVADSFRDSVIEGNSHHGILADRVDATGTLPVDLLIDCCAFEANNTSTAANMGDIWLEAQSKGVTVKHCYFTGTDVAYSIRVGAGGGYCTGFTLDDSTFVAASTNLYATGSDIKIGRGNNFSTALTITTCWGLDAIRGEFDKWGGGSAGLVTPVINTTPGGIDIDANDEFCYIYIPLLDKMTQVNAIRIWAYSNVIEADGMRLRIVAHGATGSEQWDLNPIDVPNHPSEDNALIVGDVVEWRIDATDDAQIGTLAYSDFIELLAVGEVAGDGDCATDALFGGYEIEYV